MEINNCLANDAVRISCEILNTFRSFISHASQHWASDAARRGVEVRRRGTPLTAT